MFGKGFFTKAFNEEMEQLEPETPQEEVEQPKEEVKEVKEVEQPKEEVKEEPVVEESSPVLPDKYIIDGEEYTIEQLKEFKQGYMRQSDYTRKTQELAKMRKEAEANKGDEDVSSEMKRIQKLELELESKKLDEELSALKQKYGNVDEVALLNECEKKGIYDDLEFVYKGMQNDIKKEEPSIDVEALKQKAIEEYIQTQKLKEADTIATSGSIIGSEGGTPPTDYSELLSDEEKTYCLRRGYSHKEYYDMINADYKI